MEKKPPHILMKPATAPLVSKTNAALSSPTVSAQGSPKNSMVYIVTILDRPSLTPGGSNPAVGIKFSRKERTQARANSIPSNAACLLFFICKSIPPNEQVARHLYCVRRPSPADRRQSRNHVVHSQTLHTACPDIGSLQRRPPPCSHAA